jgi:hypothetical protein
VPPQVIAIFFYYWCKFFFIAKKSFFFENYLFDPRIGFYGPKIGLEIVFSGSLVHSGPVGGHSLKWASTVGLLGRNSPKWALGRFFLFLHKIGIFFQPSNTTTKRRYNCQMETKIHAQTKKFSTRSWNFSSVIHTKKNFAPIIEKNCYDLGRHQIWALESIIGVKSWLFGQTTLNIKKIKTVKLSYITLEKSFFFHFIHSY